MKAKELPSQRRLKELFEYKDGNLIRKIVTAPNTKIGDIAGFVNNDYIIISVDGSKYKSHRLIYIYHHATIPVGLVIDHKDGNPLNNRIDNLQAIAKKNNTQKQKIHKNNKSGFKGVSWYNNGNKWRAKIRVDNIDKHLGYFEDINDAAKAYDKAAVIYHKEFAQLNFP